MCKMRDIYIEHFGIPGRKVVWSEMELKTFCDDKVSLSSTIQVCFQITELVEIGTLQEEYVKQENMVKSYFLVKQITNNF